MGPPLPEIQFMGNVFFGKEAAEVAVIVEERVGLSDGQNDFKLS